MTTFLVAKLGTSRRGETQPPLRPNRIRDPGDLVKDFPQILTLSSYFKMNPDFLITREIAMGILDINNPNKFRDMIGDGLVPPAFGQYKRNHLWSNAIVRDFKSRMDNSGQSFGEKLVVDVTLDGLDRLIENRTIKLFNY